ncbi:MAG: glycosyltransferase family 39 protein, partial [Chloroflexota bacterium]|nr:glycosyltransferase family 39 protein [Chloroflexota bacterium]
MTIHEDPAPNGDPGETTPIPVPPSRAPFRPAPYPVERDVSESRLEDEAAVAVTSRPRQVRFTPAHSRAAGFVSNWPLLVPLIAFAIAAMIVPTMTDVATTDDWGYTRAVEILYYDSELVMFPVIAATAIGQVLWGGFFALIFGMELGVMRLSTVVMVGMGAIALYAILRQLGVTRWRSSFGAALYLFNPLAFTLAFTFMTDPHFASWMLIAVALYIRGLRADDTKPWAIVCASIVAGYAFWIRQQGALIPFSVVLYLLLTRRLWFNWQSLRLGLQTALVPALMLVAYYAWFIWLNDVPDVTSVQEGFLDRAVAEGLDGTWLLVRYLTFFDAMYLGLFLLPLTVALLPGFRAGPAQRFFVSAWGYWTFLVSILLLMFGVVHFSSVGRLMPYIPQFLGSGGFGPSDVPGGRLRVVEWSEVWTGLTIGAALGAILLTLLLARRIPGEISPERAAAGLVGVVAIWQLIGMIPPSYQYVNRGGSLDRYMLPLISLTIALVLWAVRDIRLIQPAAWVGVALFGALSVAGTRDY